MAKCEKFMPAGYVLEKVRMGFHKCVYVEKRHISSETSGPCAMKLCMPIGLCLGIAGKKFDLDPRPFDLGGHYVANQYCFLKDH